MHTPKQKNPRLLKNKQSMMFLQTCTLLNILKVGSSIGTLGAIFSTQTSNLVKRV
jgi:hypothetical protein